MKKYTLLFLLSLFLVLSESQAQENSKFINGKVYAIDESGVQSTLPGANLLWLGTSKGTAADDNGVFRLKRIEGISQLVVSFIGYQSDTVDTENVNNIVAKLKATVGLDGVDIVHRQNSSSISLSSPVNVIRINEKELLKAACCNLSESFETTPSIDVSFTDAITGTRQIQMLGLAGIYTQITRENMPDVRGLSALQGLIYIPGPWIAAINLSKGTGSVVNGFESIAGQIDVHLRQPDDMDRLYLNMYANEGGRMEVNANTGFQVSERWWTAFLLHSKSNQTRNDRNKDGFLDNPIGEQYIALNRWQYLGENGYRGQIGFKGTFVDNVGGQKIFKVSDEGTTNAWGLHSNVQRAETWAKFGRVFAEKPWKSFGIQSSGILHSEESYYGLRQYNAEQKSLYGNFIYQTIIGNTNHTLKSGTSLQYDDYNENLDSTEFDRMELVPGAFIEYSYMKCEQFDIIAGLRADYHNIYGLFVTPRIHTRFALSEGAVLRASAGRGQRTANVLTENSGLLASSRTFVILGDGSDKPFGLDPEVAWNYGINFSQCFTVDYREGSISLDLYRTDFQNQIVVDLDRDPQKAVFYNLQGKSYSNSFQVQVDYELIKRVDARIAYRWYDVRSTYSGILRDKPLLSSHRSFINLAYHSRSNWKADFTLNWQGQKRIPFTESNPESYRLNERSPDFFILNAQVSKTWNEKFEIYSGVENLLNFVQEDPIISADQPFNEYFDSSLIWGPVFGRMVYAGLRYYIK